MSEIGRAFPDTFEWGTATAAHQIEGGNWNNDWWRWEHTPGSPCAEPSGDACDSWNRWIEDVGLVTDLGFDNYRFSIEWSRIEPEDGEFSTVAMDHYRRLCDVLRERQVQPVVTFHHFTTPRWVADQGGWENPANVERFGRFCEWAARRLHGLMGRACTINEPNVVAFAGYGAGFFPPGVHDRDRAQAVHENFIAAHRAAVSAIREGAPEVPVGMTLSMHEYVAVDGGESRLERIRHTMEDQYLEATAGDDFVGVQTYSRDRVGPDGMLGPEAGVPVLADGLRVLAAVARRDHPPCVGGDQGFGSDPRHRERHRHRRRRPAHRLPPRRAVRRARRPSPRASTSAATRAGACSTTSSGPTGTGRSSGSSPSTATRSRRTPKQSAYWLRDVARANALPAG